jgi:hypothetical protein
VTASIASQMFTDAAAPLLRELHGVAVTYSRGLRSISLTAIPSVIDYEAFSQDDGILTTTAEHRQYVIRAVDLSFEGLPSVPKLRDRITEEIDGQLKVYEVGPIAGKPLAELQSAAGDQWLVRARRVE